MHVSVSFLDFSSRNWIGSAMSEGDTSSGPLHIAAQI
jgi:hypothetical protein